MKTIEAGRARCIIGAVLILFTIVSCEREFSGFDHVHVTVSNVGSLDLRGCKAALGEYQSAAAALSPGSGATHLMFNRPITETAEVAFQVVGYPKETQIVPLRIPAPSAKGQSIELVFRIDGDSRLVTVDTMVVGERE